MNSEVDIKDAFKPQIGHDKVSFFLMIPIQEFIKYFRSGMLYLVNTATSHYDFLVPLRYRTEEIVLVSELLLQTYYLRYRSATYGECFYGVKRSAYRKTSLLTKDNKDVRVKYLKVLSWFKIIISLFFETLLPYLKGLLMKWSSREEPSTDQNVKK